jgi:alkylation response protein AidB-like acyl-CoA dehydrogenase
MDFDLTDDQQRFREAVVEFARGELGTTATPGDVEGFRARWEACGRFGLTGLPAREDLGGQGADPITTVVGLEALGYGSPDNGFLFSLGAHLWSALTPIERFGTAEQHDRWVRGLCDGSLVGVQAMTEPGSGSDAFALTTKATPDGDGWRLDGSKTYITNAPVADLFVVFATLDPTKGWAGLTAFVVERDAPGVSVGAPLDKMGLQSSPMAEVFFDGCRVGPGQLLAKPGAGMSVFNHSMDWERSCILATAVGCMQRQVEQSVQYAKSRAQFGQPIGKFQAVSHRIVDMRVRVDAARMLLYRMAWLKAQGKRSDVEGSIVKLFVSESWVQSSLDQLQIHGGYGYMRESGIEADVRDALASRIYSGTSEIQKNLIARQLGL